MCLHTITKEYDPPDEQERIGFKILKFGRAPIYDFKFKKNEWVCDDKDLIINSYYTSYKSGFHVYSGINCIHSVDIKYIREQCLPGIEIYKVMCRKVLCEGFGEALYGERSYGFGYGKIIVCKEIKILDKITIP